MPFRPHLVAPPCLGVGGGLTVLPSMGGTTECPVQGPRGQCLASRPTVSIWSDQPTSAGSHQVCGPLGRCQPLPEKAGKIHLLRASLGLSGVAQAEGSLCPALLLAHPPPGSAPHTHRGTRERCCLSPPGSPPAEEAAPPGTSA